MASDGLSDLGKEILLDLVRASLAGALPSESSQAKRTRLPKSSLAPSGEDFLERLRGIRRLITVREYASLAHLHPETVYRRIKAEGGMPAERDGRNVKIYPPAIADWLVEVREARKRQMSIPAPIGPKSDRTGFARAKEMEKAK